MKIIALFLSVFSIGSISAKDFTVHPIVSVNLGTQYQENFKNIATGSYSYPKSQSTWGFSVANKFYFKENWFFVLGGQYQHFNTHVFGNNEVDFVYNNPGPFEWSRGYDCFTIPIEIGRDLFFHNSNCISFRGGLSFGILSNSSLELDSQTGSYKNLNENKSIEVVTNDAGVLTTSFYTSINIHIDVQPISKWRRLFLGIYGTGQLNKSPKQYNSGLVNVMNADGNMSASYPYNMTYQSRFFNIGFSISYKFGGKYNHEM